MISSRGLRVVIPFIACFFLVDSAPFQNGTRSAREKGCFHENNHYENGVKIDTNEPCLNCTCVHSMLMCYLRICPFVKPLGEECITEKEEGDCCPKIWCPEVLDKEESQAKDKEPGCYLDGKYYPDGAQLPHDPKNPCEVCYCIKNSTACIVQECELKVEGCSPIYKDDQCCPCRYNCTYEETTTTPPGVTLQELSDGCTLDDGTYVADGEAFSSSNPCEHCYCMKTEMVCAVQECQAPSDNCVARPTEPGQCCPQQYDCHAAPQNITSEALQSTTPTKLSVSDFSTETTTAYAVSISEEQTYDLEDSSSQHGIVGIKGIPKKTEDSDFTEGQAFIKTTVNPDEISSNTPSHADYHTFGFSLSEGIEKDHAHPLLTDTKDMQTSEVTQNSSTISESEEEFSKQSTDATTSSSINFDQHSTGFVTPFQVGGIKGRKPTYPTTFSPLSSSSTPPPNPLDAHTTQYINNYYISTSDGQSRDPTETTKSESSGVKDPTTETLAGQESAIKPETFNIIDNHSSPEHHTSASIKSPTSVASSGYKSKAGNQSSEPLSKLGFEKTQENSQNLGGMAGHSVKGKRPTSSLLGRPVFQAGIPGEKRPPINFRPQIKPIPGEGICRIGHRVYSNGEAVPPTGICSTNCQCINSRIYCDDIICKNIQANYSEDCRVVKDRHECCPKLECAESTTASTQTSDLSSKPAASSSPIVTFTESSTASTDSPVAFTASSVTFPDSSTVITDSSVAHTEQSSDVTTNESGEILETSSGTPSYSIIYIKHSVSAKKPSDESTKTMDESTETSAVKIKTSNSPNDSDASTETSVPSTKHSIISTKHSVSFSDSSSYVSSFLSTDTTRETDMPTVASTETSMPSTEHSIIPTKHSVSFSESSFVSHEPSFIPTDTSSASDASTETSKPFTEHPVIFRESSSESSKTSLKPADYSSVSDVSATVSTETSDPSTEQTIISSESSAAFSESSSGSPKPSFSTTANLYESSLSTVVSTETSDEESMASTKHTVAFSESSSASTETSFISTDFSNVSDISTVLSTETPVPSTEQSNTSTEPSITSSEFSSDYSKASFIPSDTSHESAAVSAETSVPSTDHSITSTKHSDTFSQSSSVSPEFSFISTDISSDKSAFASTETSASTDKNPVITSELSFADHDPSSTSAETSISSLITTTETFVPSIDHLVSTTKHTVKPTSSKLTDIPIASKETPLLSSGHSGISSELSSTHESNTETKPDDTSTTLTESYFVPSAAIPSSFHGAPSITDETETAPPSSDFFIKDGTDSSQYTTDSTSFDLHSDDKSFLTTIYPDKKTTFDVFDHTEHKEQTLADKHHFKTTTDKSKETLPISQTTLDFEFQDTPKVESIHDFNKISPGFTLTYGTSTQHSSFDNLSTLTELSIIENSSSQSSFDEISTSDIFVHDGDKYQGYDKHITNEKDNFLVENGNTSEDVIETSHATTSSIGEDISTANIEHFKETTTSNEAVTDKAFTSEKPLAKPTSFSSENNLVFTTTEKPFYSEKPNFSSNDVSSHLFSITHDQTTKSDEQVFSSDGKETIADVGTTPTDDKIQKHFTADETTTFGGEGIKSTLGEEIFAIGNKYETTISSVETSIPAGGFSSAESDEGIAHQTVNDVYASPTTKTVSKETMDIFSIKPESSTSDKELTISTLDSTALDKSQTILPSKSSYGESTAFSADKQTEELSTSHEKDITSTNPTTSSSPSNPDSEHFISSQHNVSFHDDKIEDFKFPTETTTARAPTESSYSETQHDSFTTVNIPSRETISSSVESSTASVSYEKAQFETSPISDESKDVEKFESQLHYLTTRRPVVTHDHTIHSQNNLKNEDESTTTKGVPTGSDTNFAFTNIAPNTEQHVFYEEQEEPKYPNTDQFVFHEDHGDTKYPTVIVKFKEVSTTPSSESDSTSNPSDVTDSSDDDTTEHIEMFTQAKPMIDKPLSLVSAKKPPAGEQPKIDQLGSRNASAEIEKMLPQMENSTESTPNATFVTNKDFMNSSHTNGLMNSNLSDVYAIVDFTTTPAHFNHTNSFLTGKLETHVSDPENELVETESPEKILVSFTQNIPMEEVQSPQETNEVSGVDDFSKGSFSTQGYQTEPADRYTTIETSKLLESDSDTFSKTAFDYFKDVNAQTPDTHLKQEFHLATEEPSQRPNTNTDLGIVQQLEDNDEGFSEKKPFLEKDMQETDESGFFTSETIEPIFTDFSHKNDYRTKYNPEKITENSKEIFVTASTPIKEQKESLHNTRNENISEVHLTEQPVSIAVDSNTETTETNSEIANSITTNENNIQSKTTSFNDDIYETKSDSYSHIAETTQGLSETTFEYQFPSINLHKLTSLPSISTTSHKFDPVSHTMPISNEELPHASQTFISHTITSESTKAIETNEQIHSENESNIFDHTAREKETSTHSFDETIDTETHSTKLTDLEATTFTTNLVSTYEDVEKDFSSTEKELNTIKPLQSVPENLLAPTELHGDLNSESSNVMKTDSIDEKQILSETSVKEQITKLEIFNKSNATEVVNLEEHKLIQSDPSSENFVNNSFIDSDILSESAMSGILSSDEELSNISPDTLDQKSKPDFSVESSSALSSQNTEELEAITTKTSNSDYSKENLSTSSIPSTFSSEKELGSITSESFIISHTKNVNNDDISSDKLDDFETSTKSVLSTESGIFLTSETENTKKDRPLDKLSSGFDSFDSELSGSHAPSIESLPHPNNILISSEQTSTDSHQPHQSSDENSVQETSETEKSSFEKKKEHTTQAILSDLTTKGVEYNLKIHHDETSSHLLSEISIDDVDEKIPFSTLGLEFSDNSQQEFDLSSDSDDIRDFKQSGTEMPFTSTEETTHLLSSTISEHIAHDSDNSLSSKLEISSHKRQPSNNFTFSPQTSDSTESPTVDDDAHNTIADFPAEEIWNIVKQFNADKSQAEIHEIDPPAATSFTETVIFTTRRPSNQEASYDGSKVAQNGEMNKTSDLRDEITKTKDELITNKEFSSVTAVPTIDDNDSLDSTSKPLIYDVILESAKPHDAEDTTSSIKETFDILPNTFSSKFPSFSSTEALIEELTTQYPIYEHSSNISHPSSTLSPTTSDITANETHTGGGYCYYENSVFNSAEQIPRKDPCEFCFCFRGDIICLQQTCPPPIRGCFAEPIEGFCCPRFHCPVHEMRFNISRTTTTTPDPRHHLFPGVLAAGCEIEGHAYRVQQVIRTASGPCMLCRCESGGMMKCDPRECQPQPPLLLRLNRDFFRRR